MFIDDSILQKNLNDNSWTTYTELILHGWKWLKDVNDQTVEHKTVYFISYKQLS